MAASPWPAPAPSPDDRTNFVRVCRVVLDHVPKVLRQVFKDRIQSKHNYTWTDTPASGQWLVSKPRNNVTTKLIPTQNQLLKSGKTDQWDPTLLFHVLRSSALALLLDEVSGTTIVVVGQQSTINIQSGTTLPGSVVKGSRVFIDSGKKTEYGEIAAVTPTQVILTSKLKGNAPGAKVYLCTPGYEAVDTLRELRNVCFGHVTSATTPTADLDNLLKKVEQAYTDLSRPTADIENLQRIKTEAILDTDTFERYRKRIEELQKQSQEYEKRSQEYEQHLEDLEHRQDEVESRQDELESNQGVTGKQVESNTQNIGELQEKVAELSHGVVASKVRIGELEGEVEKLSRQDRGGNQGVQVMIPQAGTVNVFNYPPLPQLSNPPPILSIDSSPVHPASLTTDLLGCSEGTIVSRGGGPIARTSDPPSVPVSLPLFQDLVMPTLAIESGATGLSSRGNTTPEQFQWLNPQYNYFEDHSGGQSRYKCVIKYTTSSGPGRVDSGGYHATKESATKAAESKLPPLPVLKPRGSMQRDYKSELKKFYVEEKGVKDPRIIYRVREVTGRGHQATVVAPGMGSVKGDYCTTRGKAEGSAAHEMLTKIQDSQF